PGEASEWTLVRIAGTITKVTRLGERWRADVQVGGDLVLVAGLAGSGIPSTAVEEGRRATIVGIVRRAYPTSTDRRWSVVPRGSWDIALGPASDGGAGASAGHAPSGAGRNGSGSGSGSASAGGSQSSGAASGVTTIDLATLADHVGELARVGGLVDSDAPDGFMLDDGTAIARIVLGGDAAVFADLIEPGDAIGVEGRVARAEAGAFVVVVTDPAGLVRLGALGETIPLGTSATDGVSGRRTGEPGANATQASLAGPFDDGPAGWLGIGGILALSVTSLLVTFLRRRSGRRRVLAVARARIAGLRRAAEPAPPPFGSA
ncbi:MAG: OB-fold nucleic acid binding domain-containing protein, partial [Candidatus Limnocylindrales bacterium]